MKGSPFDYFRTKPIKQYASECRPKKLSEMGGNNFYEMSEWLNKVHRLSVAEVTLSFKGLPADSHQMFIPVVFESGMTHSVAFDKTRHTF